MKAQLTNRCPPMPVYATWRPRLRKTTELKTTGIIRFEPPAPGSTTQIMLFGLTFPVTNVWLMSAGYWMVDAGVARGFTEDGGTITVAFEPEGVHRATPEECIKYGGKNLMIAEKFHAQVRVVLKDGRVGTGGVTYPEVAADPGVLYGLFSYTVREVNATGSLEFA